MPSGRLYFDPVSATYKPVIEPDGTTSLAAMKKARGVVKKNAGASVVDLGDGVAAIELHSKMNALGEDIVLVANGAEILRVHEHDHGWLHLLSSGIAGWL